MTPFEKKALRWIMKSQHQFLEIPEKERIAQLVIHLNTSKLLLASLSSPLPPPLDEESQTLEKKLEVLLGNVLSLLQDVSK
jgi:hypothetical protein